MSPCTGSYEALRVAARRILFSKLFWEKGYATGRLHGGVCFQIDLRYML